MHKGLLWCSVSAARVYKGPLRHSALTSVGVTVLSSEGLMRVCLGPMWHGCSIARHRVVLLGARGTDSRKFQLSMVFVFATHGGS